MSVQVLGEFHVTVTRKLSTPLTPDAAAQAVDAFCEFQIEALHPELIRSAVRRSQSSRLSYRDSLIVETVLNVGAGVLFTEDLQENQEFDGLRVVNPFLDGGRT